MRIERVSVQAYLQADGSFRAFVNCDTEDKRLEGKRTRATWREAVTAALDDISEAEAKASAVAAETPEAP